MVYEDRATGGEFESGVEIIRQNEAEISVLVKARFEEDCSDNLADPGERKLRQHVSTISQ